MSGRTLTQALTLALTLTLTLTLAGCRAAFDPAELPADDWLVLVKSSRLPNFTGWVPSQAHHTWFEIKAGSEEDWILLEVDSGAVFTDQNVLRRREVGPALSRWTTRYDHDVYLHRVIQGDEAQQVAAELLAEAEVYEDRDNYRAWPGPNSNSFVERLLRRTGLTADLDHNAVGKDYALFLRGGVTAGGTGLELETLLLGVELGLRGGIQLHLLQLTFGVDFWPPAILLPFLPRLGW